jgi:hypothetical protein
MNTYLIQLVWFNLCFFIEISNYIGKYIEKIGDKVFVDELSFRSALDD